MSFKGNIRLGGTLDFKFTTIDVNGGGATLLDGEVAAYPGNSVTQITAGITLTADFDGVTGLNHVRVEATEGNGFAADTNYSLVMTAGTVDGASIIGYVIAVFNIGALGVDILSVNGVDVIGTGTEIDPWRSA